MTALYNAVNRLATRPRMCKEEEEFLITNIVLMITFAKVCQK